MKPKTFFLIIGALILFGGGIFAQSVVLMGIGFVVMVGAWFVKWPQSADSTQADAADRYARQARRDERVRSLARRFKG